MKKARLILVAILIVIFSLCVFTACGDPGKTPPVKFSVSFESDGVQYATVSTAGSETIAMPADPTKEGYTFGGWFWDKDTWAEPFTASSLLTQPLKANMTVYAKFSKNEYTVTYDTNGGSEIAPMLCADITAYPDTTKLGYKIEGLYKTADFAEDSKITLPYSVTEEQTLYVKWELIEYTITYNLDGGTLADDAPDKFDVTSEITLPEPEKDNHSFEGWYSTADFSGEAVTEISGQTGNVALFAKWKINEYTVAFDTNGGSAVEPVRCWQLTELPVTTKLGYTIAGLYKTADFAEDSKIAFPYAVTEAQTLHIKWELIEYTITYNLDGGTLADGAPHKFNITSVIALPSPEKEQFSFEGWYSTADFSGEVVTEISGQTGSVALYAKWIAGTDDLAYVLNDEKTAYSVGIYSGIANDIIIPSAYFGLPVTGINARAFADCDWITSVVIPNSVTSIGANAFSGCTLLKSIKLPFVGATKEDTRNSFFGYIFGATRYYDNSKYVPSGLTSVTIGNSVTSIDSSAFYGCSGLTNVTIPNSVTSIGYEAFRGCSGLTSITIPDSVTSIGGSAFRGCSGLTSITIPDSVTSIGYEAFSGCTNITTATMPTRAISYIPKAKLKTVILTSGTSINNSAFYECSGLTSVTIGNSVTIIGEYAFYRCSGLESITIPAGVTSIGGSAFYECSGLTSVTIGNSVTSIGSYAFSGCSGLTSVTIGSGVTSIGGSAFYGCRGLTSITIPDSVTSIGNYAFRECSRLTSITIPDSVTSIGACAFRECSWLTKINCEAASEPSGWDIDWNVHCSASVVWGYKG